MVEPRVADAPAMRSGPVPPGAGARHRRRMEAQEGVFGLVLAFAWPAAMGVLGLGFDLDVGLTLLAFAGLSQWPFVAGVAILARRVRRAGVVRGVVAGALAILILNAIAWSWLLTGL